MPDRQRPRARVLAAVCVLALVAAVVAVALVPSGATFARFFDEAGDSSGSTLSSQQIAATTAGVITPDYGDWNWFDRQTNETSLTVTNSSPTSMVATVAIGSVALTGANTGQASGKARAYVIDRNGAKQQIASSVTTTRSTTQFPEANLSWTLAPGASQKIVVGVESNSTQLLYQRLVGAAGAKFDFRFAVNWSVDGLSSAESAELYPHGALGPNPGDRAACPAGATAAQECRGVAATVKRPVVTVATGSNTTGACSVTDNFDLSHTFSVNTSTLAAYSGLAKTARELQGSNPGNYGSYAPIPDVGSGFTGTSVEVVRQPFELGEGYDLTFTFVIRGTGGAGSHVPGPNGERATQSPVYTLSMKREPLSLFPTCSVSLASL